MSIIRRKFKLYNNRPSQRIDEMSATDLQLLKTHAEAMSSACGFADDGKEYIDLHIHTLEGDHHASVGDYIIKGVNGEFYPCKPDIFEKTYDIVKD